MSECQALIDMTRVCIYRMSLAEQGPVNMANLASVGRAGGGGEKAEAKLSRVAFQRFPAHRRKAILVGVCSDKTPMW